MAGRSLPEITAVIEFGRQIKEITGGASLERLTPKSDQEIPKGKNIQSGKPYPNVRLGNTKRKNIQSDIQPYQIIVADAADAVSVNFSGRCKFLQI